MKRFLLLVSLLGVVLLAAGCRSVPPDTVTQVATIDALLAGAYDGTMLCRDLRGYGDFGIGTFDRLDGEMVMLRGHVYQVPSTGVVRKAGAGQTTPFASVCRFEPEASFPLPQGTDFAGAQQLIDSWIGNPNSVCACHIRGTFRRMRTRSVPPQDKPYRPLVEVVKNQPVFEMEEIEGEIVGFYLPAFVKGINVPGYHLHFLSADCTKGGHILDFEVESATVSIDHLSRVYLLLGGLSSDVDLSKDRSQELHRVEGSK